MKKMKILIPVGYQSDEAIIDPIIKRLENQDWCEILVCELYYLGKFSPCYTQIEMEIKIEKPDLILITGDKVEMTATACAAFYNGVKIAHIYAGTANNSFSTLDDINRHYISLWADICFCENQRARENIQNLWIAADKAKDYIFDSVWKNLHVIGITHPADKIVEILEKWWRKRNEKN